MCVPTETVYGSGGRGDRVVTAAGYAAREVIAEKRAAVDLIRIGRDDLGVSGRRCENRNEEDALLHSYLRTMTARSRSIMEKALIRLSEIEKIPFVDPDA